MTWATTIAIVTVLAVHDGDTLTVNLTCSEPVVCQSVPIRIAGIDAPELRDKRPEVKALAIKARDRLRELLAGQTAISLTAVKRDKYFRLDARVAANGRDVGEVLTAEGLARAWTGAGKKPW